MREAVVILLPYVRRKQIVQRSNGEPPRQLLLYFQPLGVLDEHRIDDADEGLVGIEQSVPTGQQVAFQLALALVFAEHGIEDAACRRQKFIVVDHPGVPLTISGHEHCAQEIGQCLVRAENSETALMLIKRDDIAQELVEHEGIYTRSNVVMPCIIIVPKSANSASRQVFGIKFLISPPRPLLPSLANTLEANAECSNSKTRRLCSVAISPKATRRNWLTIETQTARTSMKGPLTVVWSKRAAVSALEDEGGAFGSDQPRMSI